VSGTDDPAPERLTAWRCIGCGRFEAPKPCIGVCKDRKVEFVDALAYDALREELAQMERFVRFIASVKPRPQAVGATLEEFRRRARELLGGRS
jgi:hypothetical protein